MALRDKFGGVQGTKVGENWCPGRGTQGTHFSAMLIVLMHFFFDFECCYLNVILLMSLFVIEIYFVRFMSRCMSVVYYVASVKCCI